MAAAAAVAVVVVVMGQVGGQGQVVVVLTTLVRLVVTVQLGEQKHMGMLCISGLSYLRLHGCNGCWKSNVVAHTHSAIISGPTSSLLIWIHGEIPANSGGVLMPVFLNACTRCVAS